MPMTITPVTAPTRGPDYTMPSGNHGTPIVTATAAVAPASSFSTIPAGSDIFPPGLKKKKPLRSVDRAPPQRFLTASRGTIVPLLPDVPTGTMTTHLAVQAYQAQRRATSDEAAHAPAMPSALLTPASPAAGFDVLA